MRIGIALAAYKPDPAVFAEQLHSILNQNHPDWICVITCDSPLKELLSNSTLAPFCKDPRLIWIENVDRLGHKKNFEKAIQEVLRRKVDAIACSDQDDIWYPNKLSACIEAFKKQGYQSLVHSDMHILQGKEKLQKTAWFVEKRGIHNHSPVHFLVRNIVAGCSMMFDPELARRYPTIPEAAEFHDHWYALVASFYGGIRAVAQPLYAYRQHPENEVGVSPYRSLLWVPQGSTLLSIVNKCKVGWKKSQRLAQAALDAGLPFPCFLRIIYLSRWDFGVGIILLGIFHLKDDRALARACLARGIGKALCVVSFDF